MSDSAWREFVLEVIKTSLKPGYLYGVKNGELYVAKADIPDPGETYIGEFEMAEGEK